MWSWLHMPKRRRAEAVSGRRRVRSEAHGDVEVSDPAAVKLHTPECGFWAIPPGDCNCTGQAELTPEYQKRCLMKMFGITDGELDPKVRAVRERQEMIRRMGAGAAEDRRLMRWKR